MESPSHVKIVLITLFFFSGQVVIGFHCNLLYGIFRDAALEEPVSFRDQSNQ